MKKSHTLAILLVLLAFAAGCASPGQNAPSTSSDKKEQGFLVYEDKAYGVRMGYAADWQQKEQEGTIVSFLSPKSSSSDPFQENINLVMNDLSGQQISLDDYTTASLETLRGVFPDMAVGESGSTTLDGNPAHKIVYTAKAGGANLKVMQAWTIKDDISYVLTYTAEEAAFPDYVGVMQKTMDTFEILGIQPQDQQEPAQPQKQEPMKQEANLNVDQALVGRWRIYSEAIYYDEGGNDWLNSPSSRMLYLNEDGTWDFGDSGGTWEVNDITPEDWARWDIGSYGPTRKIVLNNWNKGTADGPIEESASRVDFVWAIYHVDPPTATWPGTIWMKFGHTSS